jgi:hypothetical protein
MYQGQAASGSKLEHVHGSHVSQTGHLNTRIPVEIPILRLVAAQHSVEIKYNTDCEKIDFSLSYICALIISLKIVKLSLYLIN